MVNKTVLIGITGSIAAFKTLELIKLLKDDGVKVEVIMTRNAMQMIPKEEVEEATGHKVYTELFEKDFDYRQILKTHKVNHIEMAHKADLIVIVPATANFIAKIALGLADDLLTTTLLASNSPIILCPAMNPNMWSNPIVQENISKLKNNGVNFIEPNAGILACGDTGYGRLQDVKIIKDEIMNQLNRSDSLKGKKVIVTAGATIEKIDDVRYITNRSSGKMGAALAEECHLRGARVLLLRAKNAVKPRYSVTEKLFTTADDLLSLIKENINDYDVIFHTSAVGDFQVTKPQIGKISSNVKISLELTPQIKILDQIKKLSASRRTKIKLIAFKAEHGLSETELIQISHDRLMESKCDAIIANDISKPDRGFEADTNEVYIIMEDKKVHKLPLASKKQIAKQIIDYLF